MKRTHSQFARFMELDRLIREKKNPNCLTFSNNWGVAVLEDIGQKAATSVSRL